MQKLRVILILTALCLFLNGCAAALVGGGAAGGYYFANHYQVEPKNSN